MSDILQLRARGSALNAHDDENPGTEFDERLSSAESPSSGRLSLHMPSGDEMTPDELL